MNDKRHDISSINFRNKKQGWKNYHISLETSNTNTVSLVEPLHKNIFMQGFLKDLFLRPSCYNCPSKSFKGGSDITLGDYWGIGNVVPEFDDDKGVSLVMVNSPKGQIYYNKIQKDAKETSYSDALAHNPSIEKSVILPIKRKVFFKKWKTMPVITLIEQLTRIPFLSQVKRKIIRTSIKMLKWAGLYSIVKSFLKR